MLWKRSFDCPPGAFYGVFVDSCFFIYKFLAVVNCLVLISLLCQPRIRLPRIRLSPLSTYNTPLCPSRFQQIPKHHPFSCLYDISSFQICFHRFRQLSPAHLPSHFLFLAPWSKPLNKYCTSRQGFLRNRFSIHVLPCPALSCTPSSKLI